MDRLKSLVCHCERLFDYHLVRHLASAARKVWWALVVSIPDIPDEWTILNNDIQDMQDIEEPGKLWDWLKFDPVHRHVTDVTYSRVSKSLADLAADHFMTTRFRTVKCCRRMGPLERSMASGQLELWSSDPGVKNPTTWQISALWKRENMG